MIGFSAPLGLGALAALALPLLIHLMRRPQERVLDFPALRWTGRQNSPRERLHLRERVLLALRLLLLLVLALLLAQLGWRSQPDAGALWVAVAPGVDPVQARQHLAAQGEAVHAVWLAPGFPDLDAADLRAPTAVASLLRQLDAELAPELRLSVLVPRQLGGLDAERPQLARAVDWTPLSGATVAQAPPEPPGLVVYADDEAAARLWLAALAAAAPLLGHELRYAFASGASVPMDPGAWAVWLGSEGANMPPDLAAWVAVGGRALAAPLAGAAGAVVVRDESGQPLLRERPWGLGRLLYASAPIDPARDAAWRAPALPAQLLPLFEQPARAPGSADADAVAPTAGARTGRTPLWTLDAVLVVLAALLFTAERCWRAFSLRSVA